MRHVIDLHVYNSILRYTSVRQIGIEPHLLTQDYRYRCFTQHTSTSSTSSNRVHPEGQQIRNSILNQFFRTQIQASPKVELAPPTLLGDVKHELKSFMLLVPTFLILLCVGVTNYYLYEYILTLNSYVNQATSWTFTAGFSYSLISIVFNRLASAGRSKLCVTISASIAGVIVLIVLQSVNDIEPRSIYFTVGISVFSQMVSQIVPYLVIDSTRLSFIRLSRNLLSSTTVLVIALVDVAYALYISKDDAVSDAEAFIVTGIIFPVASVTILNVGLAQLNGRQKRASENLSQRKIQIKLASTLKHTQSVKLALSIPVFFGTLSPKSDTVFILSALSSLVVEVSSTLLRYKFWRKTVHPHETDIYSTVEEKYSNILAHEEFAEKQAIVTAATVFFVFSDETQGSGVTAYRLLALLLFEAVADLFKNRILRMYKFYPSMVDVYNNIYFILSNISVGSGVSFAILVGSTLVV